MGNKYLSECINVERDILPNKIIQISAGVGAGKNTWVRKCLFPNYKCLYITSRRNIVNAELDKAEQAYNKGEGVRARRTLNLFELSETERHEWWGKAPQSEFNIITTSAYDRFKYIRFNHFEQEFDLYEARKIQEVNYETDNSNVMSYYEDYTNPAVYNLIHPVQKWFDTCWCEEFEDIGILVKRYLEENKLLGTPYPRKDNERVIREINKLISKYYAGDRINKKNSLGPLLKQFGYKNTTVDVNGKASHKVTGDDAYILIEKN